MAESSIKQRIQLVGADEVKRSFEQIGKAGEEAFKQIDNASKSVKFDKNLTKNLDAARVALGQVGSVAKGALNEINQSASTELVRGLGATGGAATKLGDAFAAVSGGLLRLAGPAGALVVAGGAVQLFAKRTLDSVTELRNAAKNLDISVPNLSAFRNGAKQAGITDDNLASGISDFAKRVRESRAEIERATQTFQVFTSGGDQAAVTIRRFNESAQPTSKAAKEIADTLNKLGVSLGEIVDKNSNLTPEGLIRLARAFNAKFTTSFDKDIAISRLGLEKFSDILKGTAEDIDRTERAFKAGTQAAPNQNLQDLSKKYEDAVKNLKEATGNLGTEFDKFGQKVTEAVGPSVIKIIDGITTAINLATTAAEKLNAVMEKLRPTGNTPKEEDAKLAMSGFTVGAQALKFVKDYYDTLGNLWSRLSGDSEKSTTQIDNADAAAQRLKKTIDQIPKLNGLNPELQGQTGNDLGGGSANDTLAPKVGGSAWQQFQDDALAAFEVIRAAAVTLGQDINTSVAGAFQAVETSAQNAASSIQQAATNMKDALQSVIQTASAATYAVGGNGGTVQAATGGYITGPGTTTSDSIPAWLSNGEFVVKAQAVRKYGLDLLHSINGLSMPRFADGGLVGAVAVPALAGAGGATGRPLVLNIGGESFALSAPQDVADKLTRYAAKRVVASAGRRPSWVGG